MSAPVFFNNGMNRNSFDMLSRNVQWIHHPDVQCEYKIHEDHRWKLVEDFVTNFNDYHTQLFSPSDIIYADESISRWYVQDGNWINLFFQCMCQCAGIRILGRGYVMMHVVDWRL